MLVNQPAVSWCLTNINGRLICVARLVEGDDAPTCISISFFVSSLTVASSFEGMIRHVA